MLTHGASILGSALAMLRGKSGALVVMYRTLPVLVTPISGLRPLHDTASLVARLQLLDRLQ